MKEHAEINKAGSQPKFGNHFFGSSKTSGTPVLIQPKLTINDPNDEYEKEADVMADKVMRMEKPFIQAKPLPITSVQRKCEHCEEEENKMQRKEMHKEEVTANHTLESYVGNLNGSGQSLTGEVRNFYEPRFGYDFSNVKVHTDAVAAKSAQSINALAYTSGNSIVFNSNRYSPNTESGKRLLGHELTHVMQQGKGIATKIQRKVPPMPCDVATTSPAGVVGANFLFSTSATSLTVAQRNDIAIFVKSWQASGGKDNLRIDGYASKPGADELNWRLSCDRALSVASELRNNGVPDAMMEFFAQGETNQFGVEGNNQRADITILAPPPPVPITIAGNDELWFFNGETPAGYPLQQALTANSGGIPGVFNWSIVRGAAFADFNGTVVAAGPNVVLKSKRKSAALKDVEVKVEFVGGTGGTANKSFTVKEPTRLRSLRNDDTVDATFAYMTFVHYSILDQFNTVLPRNVLINEHFTGAPVADFAGMDWRRGANGSANVNPADWNDRIGGETPGHTPPAVGPADPNAGVAVYHWPGTWQVGSATIGSGSRVATITWSKFRGRARHT